MPGPLTEMLSDTTTAPSDNVILLGDAHEVVGEAPRVSVHTRQTPLHLAFSCYVENEAGELLLTRRALTKATWPGVWTNSCCGHPRPGEEMTDAIRRRLDDELELSVGELTCVLPDFAYTATDASGILENEVCPVFWAQVAHPTPHIEANPEEVMNWKWVPWDDLVKTAKLTPFVFSPWSVQQISLLSTNAQRDG